MDKYSVIKELGKGGEGVVYKVMRNEDKKVFALKKKLCSSLEDANFSLQEAVTMVRVESPYVVKFEEVFLETFKEQGIVFYYLCIVIEFCSQGDLFDRIDELSRETQIAQDLFFQTTLIKWIWQLLMGIQAIHQQKLVHRDIKTENCFLHSGQSDIKIGDFGLSSRVRSTKEKCGTYCYLAPEAFEDQGVPFDNKVDVWAAGCIIFEMVTLNLLPIANLSIGQEALSKTWDPKAFISSKLGTQNSIPAAVKQLLSMIFIRDPLHRPSVKKLLEHPIFTTLHTQHTEQKGDNFEKDDLTRRQLNRSHLKEAVEVLTESGSHDERWVYVNSNPEVRRQLQQIAVAPNQIASAMAQGSGFWGLLRDDRIIGVALWLPPDDLKSIPISSVAKAAWKALSIGCDPFKIKKLANSVNNIYDSMKFGRHWRLYWISILPEYQGRNYGQYLLDPVLKWAQQEAIPVITHCYNQSNVKFFHKLGFDVVHHKSATDTPEFWLLKKDWIPKKITNMGSTTTFEGYMKKYHKNILKGDRVRLFKTEDADLCYYKPGNILAGKIPFRDIFKICVGANNLKLFTPNRIWTLGAAFGHENHINTWVVVIRDSVIFFAGKPPTVITASDATILPEDARLPTSSFNTLPNVQLPPRSSTEGKKIEQQNSLSKAHAPWQSSKLEVTYGQTDRMKSRIGMTKSPALDKASSGKKKKEILQNSPFLEEPNETTSSKHAAFQNQSTGQDKKSSNSNNNNNDTKNNNNDTNKKNNNNDTNKNDTKNSYNRNSNSTETINIPAVSELTLKTSGEVDISDFKEEIWTIKQGIKGLQTKLKNSGMSTPQRRETIKHAQLISKQTHILSMVASHDKKIDVEMTSDNLKKFAASLGIDEYGNEEETKRSVEEMFSILSRLTDLLDNLD